MLTRLPAGTSPPNLLLTDASGRQFIHPDTSKRVNGKYRKNRKVPSPKCTYNGKAVSLFEALNTKKLCTVLMSGSRASFSRRKIL